MGLPLPFGVTALGVMESCGAPLAVRDDSVGGDGKLWGSPLPFRVTAFGDGSCGDPLRSDDIVGM